MEVSPLHKANHIIKLAYGATIWLKREDMYHMGAHNINNTIVQALLSKRIDKIRIIGKTGAG